MLSRFRPLYNLSVLRMLRMLLLLPATLFPQVPSSALAPGASIPPFSLPDQLGTRRTFNDIRGPKGAMLVFYRSADW